MNTLQEAYAVAEEAWRKCSKEKSGISRRRCPLCFDKWRKDGSKPEDRPPVYPCDFQGKCPSCGGELSHPSIPF